MSFLKKVGSFFARIGRGLKRAMRACWLAPVWVKALVVSIVLIAIAAIWWSVVAAILFAVLFFYIVYIIYVVSHDAAIKSTREAMKFNREQRAKVTHQDKASRKADRARRGITPDQDRWANKAGLLRRKARATSNPDEERAFTAAYKRLMKDHDLTESMLFA